jgi:hypothetical protein
VCRHGKKTKGISQSQILMPNNKYAGSAVVAQSSPPVEIVRRLLGEPKAVSPSVEMGEEDTQRTSKIIQRSSAGNGDQRAWDCGSLRQEERFGIGGYGVVESKRVACRRLTGAMDVLPEQMDRAAGRRRVRPQDV